MHITVLGGTGFIGPHVVRRLVAEGHRVTLVHRGEHERDDLGEARHVHAERADLAAAMPAIGDADVAVDMAPFTETQARQAVEALRGHAGRLVTISSVDVYRAYGALRGLEESPLPEPPIDEDSPLRTVLHPYRDEPLGEGAPEWLHEYDKIPVERLTMSDPQMQGTVLRLGAVYGPGDRQHRLLDLVARIDDGRSVVVLERSRAAFLWPHVYVENVAAAVVRAVVDERAAGRIYNVGPPRTLSVGEWTRAAGEALGWHGRVAVVPDGSLGTPAESDIRHNVNVVSERIRSELGLVDPVDFATGVRRAAEWEREHRRAGGAGPTADDYRREDTLLDALQG